MQVIYLLFLAGLAQGVLGKSVLVSEDDFDFDMLRERRSPGFDDDDLSDAISDDYDGGFLEGNQVDQQVPPASDDSSAVYEFPVKSEDVAQKANDAAKDALKALEAQVKKLTEQAAAVAKALEKVKKESDKAAAAAKAAAAKAKAAATKAKAAAAKAKAAAAKKPAAKAAAKKPAPKTQEINVVIRLPKETFKPQLQKSTSKEYQALGKKLQDQCVAIYKTDLKGFKVKKFSPGSVVVDMALKFLESQKDPLKKLKDFLKKGKFAGFDVCSSLLKAYNKKGVLCAGACPNCPAAAPVAAPVSTCPSQCSPVSSYPAPVSAPVYAPAPAPVYAPAPAPVYAPPAPVPSMCPSTCSQSSCPATCPSNCCVSGLQGR